MRYLKDTLSYLFVHGKGKRFLFLFLCALVPSTMIAYGLRVENLFINMITPPQYTDWPSVWLSYFNTPYDFVSIIIGLICAILATACIMGALIRHFRVGDFSLKLVFRSFNDYALPSTLYTFAATVILALGHLIFTLFAFMWYNVCDVVGYTVLCFVTIFIISSIDVYLISSITLWLPTMCIKGTYSHNALAKSYYQSRGKQKYFIWGHVVCAFILVITALISYLVSSNWYVSWIINAVGYAIYYAFLLTYITTVYFGENGLPRQDIGVSPYKRRI